MLHNHHKHHQRIKFLKHLIIAMSTYIAVYLGVGYLYGRFYASQYTFVSGRPFGYSHCKSAPILPPNQKTVRILILPGGAINGILPLRILQYLEHKTKQPIHSLFDFIAATSTGSLIAAGLTYPDAKGQPAFSTDDVLRFYDQFGPYALSAPWWYRAITINGLLGPRYLGTRLRDQLAKTFNNHTEFTQLLTPTMISVYDLNERRTYAFKSWKCQHQPAYHTHEILTAATATPGFFPPVQLQDLQKKRSDVFIDGGVAVNNPAVLALHEAMKLYPHRKYLIVILNTGNIFDSVHWETSYKWGIFNWLPKVFAILITAQKHQADASLRFVQSLLPPGTIQIENINIDVRESESTFNPSQHNIQLLNKLADNYIESHQKQLSVLANTLVTDR